jgi:hypothetical protein
MADDTMPGGMPPLESGGRFKKCVAAARKRGIAKPEGFCAQKGRRKYGDQGMVALAQDGTAGAAKARAGEKAGGG